MHHAGDERRENEWGDDHLDQPQEDIGQDLEVARDRLALSCVGHEVVEACAHQNPQHETDHDE